MFDNLAIRLCGQRACSTNSSSTSGTTNTMKVDFVTLRGLVVDDSRNVFDIKTTRRDVSGKEVG